MSNEEDNNKTDDGFSIENGPSDNTPTEKVKGQKGHNKEKEEQEKLKKLSDALGLGQLQQDLDYIKNSITELWNVTKTNAQTLQETVNAVNSMQSGEQQPQQQPQQQNIASWNQKPQDTKIHEMMEFLKPLAEAYKEIKGGGENPANAQFQQMATDYVMKLLQAQLDNVTIQTYNTQLQPPSWVEGRVQGSASSKPVKHGFE